MDMRDALQRICRVAGKRVPKRVLPPVMMRLSTPIWPLIARLTGLPPNARELMDNVGATFYASDAKARRDLGYSPRDVDSGLIETLASL
jgi:nucleoside-diphosphate-sugar epimerase